MVGSERQCRDHDFVFVEEIPGKDGRPVVYVWKCDKCGEIRNTRTLERPE